MTADATKQCPYCAEKIAFEAKKCRFCGVFLEGGPGPIRLEQPVRWEQDAVRVQLAGNLPQSCCMICGSAAELRLKKKDYTYVTPVAYLALFLGLLPGAIVLLVLQKKKTLRVPVCPRCGSRWTLSSVVLGLYGVFGFFGLPILFGMIGSEMEPQVGGIWGAMIGFFVWIVSIVVLMVVWAPRRQVVCKRIDDSGILLKVPAPEVLRAAWTEAGVAEVEVAE